MVGIGNNEQEAGQSLVEYALLLLVVSGITMVLALAGFALVRAYRSVTDALVVEAEEVATAPDDEEESIVEESGPQTITVRVNASSDDAYDDGRRFRDDRDVVTLGPGNRDLSAVGLRFTGVEIPRGASILSAEISMVKSGSAWNPWQFTWYGEAAANPPTFGERASPADRSRTAAAVNHDSDERMDNKIRYVLDDVAPIVAEIVGRDDWRSGSALVLLGWAQGRSNRRYFFYTYDKNPAYAPELTIEFELPDSDGGGGQD